MAPVAIVTDSTAALGVPGPGGVTVVPLHIVVGEDEYTEGVDIVDADVVAALRRGPRVSTSRPSPQAFLQAYERLADQGATEIVSVHISAALSGTCEAALLAARQAPVPVWVVDSRTTGFALGHAVLAAARAAEDGMGGAALARLVAARAGAASTVFYVHTLEYLRRGGRIGAAAGLLGAALAVKPLLSLSDGRVEPREKLRTAARALSRLTDLAVARAQASDGPVAVGIHHVDAPERAARIAETVAERLAGGAGPVVTPVVIPLPAVLTVHLGPGAVGAVVAPDPV